MNQIGQPARRDDPIVPHSLSERLAAYADRHQMRFSDGGATYTLSWRRETRFHFIEVDKGSGALRSGAYVNGAPIYECDPTFLGVAPLDQLLEEQRRSQDDR